MRLWLDIETISTVDVTIHGVYAHAEDPTLDITVACWAIDDGPIQTWAERPSEGTVSAPPIQLAAAMVAADEIWCHNAAYERLVTAAVWEWSPPMSKWRDSAVVARWYNLPGSLDGMSGYLLGKAYAKLSSAPFKYLWSTASLPWEDEEDAALEEMVAYCTRDVEAMRNCTLMLPPLPDAVWEQYATSEEINDYGVALDRPFAEAARDLRAVVDEETKAELVRLTNGKITSPRGPSAREWTEAQLAGIPDLDLLDDEGRLTRGFKKRRKDRVGFYTETRATFDKPMRTKVRETLEEAVAGRHIIDVLDLVDEGQNAAITKYASSARRLTDDGRLRGMYIFAGASQTHRFSSTGVQTHNLLRDTLSDVDDYALRLAVVAQERDLTHLRAVDTHGLSRALSMALRATLKAHDPEVTELVWADWSAIEARGLPWLAGDTEKLRMFESGVDIYVENAKNLFWVPEIDKDQRQVGKVQELALGYGGGKGAFEAMSRGYGVKLPPDQVTKAVASWREINPTICEYWTELQDAAFAAIRNPTQPQFVRGKIAYIYAPNVAFGSLLVALPDGSMLVYPKARIEQVEKDEEGEWVEEAIVFDHPTYGRSALWHGTLVENITQAICASLLREALVTAQREGLKVVAHTHDEIVVEVPLDETEDAMRLLQEIMETPPAWAEGLPLDAEAEAGSRYKVPEAAY